MKQIITVLAILISGIASAQGTLTLPPTQLYEASICGGGPTNPRHVDFNDLDYVLADGYRTEIENQFGRSGDNVIICLSAEGNRTSNWRSYWLNYRGAVIEDQTDHNWYRITFPGINNGAGRIIEIQRRTGGRYNVISRLRDNQVGYWDLGSDPQDAWEYAGSPVGASHFAELFDHNAIRSLGALVLVDINTLRIGNDIVLRYRPETNDYEETWNGQISTFRTQRSYIDAVSG